VIIRIKIGIKNSNDLTNYLFKIYESIRITFIKLKNFYI
jgi:hypothetical protein